MRNIKRFMSFVLVFAMLMTSLSCLGGVFSVTASAADTITNLDGITRSPGQHGRSVPLNESDLSGSYIYLSGTVYELDNGYSPAYDFMNHSTVTDGYVQPGDYVVLVVKLLTSQAAIYSITYWFAHTLDFFEVPFDNANDPISLAPMNSSNTNLQTKGVLMNFDNDDVNTNIDNAYGLSFKATTNNNSIYSEAGQAQLITNSGYTQAQLESTGCSRFISNKSGSATVIAGEDDEWTLAVLYKVSEDAQEGDMGSIYIPYTDSTHSLWKYPGMTAQVAGPKQANIITKATSPTGANVQLNKFTGTFDFSDFGATLKIGDPSAQGDTYTVSFYDEGGTTPVSTIGNLASGAQVALADAPEMTPPAGKEFAGWVDSNNNAVSWPLTVTADTALYATYSAATYNLTINYQYANGTQAAPTHTETGLAYNAAYSVASPAITGYTPNQATVSGNITANTTVTVTYTVNTYTATFYDDDGTTELGTSTAAYGANIPSIANPTTHPGATFLGWSETLGGSVVTSLGTMPVGGKNFYAKWQAATVFIDFYDTNLIDYLDGVNCTVGSDISNFAPTDYTVPAGQTFIGWFVIDLDTFELSDRQITTVPNEQNLMLAPKFEAASFTVTFLDQNGNPAGTQTGNAGDQIVPPTISNIPTGHSVAWVDTNNNPMPATIEGNATYQAVFVANEYPLTINYVKLGGGTAAESYTANVAYGSFYSVVSPTVTGYTPDEATVTGYMDTVGGKTVNVTYSPNAHTITWVIDGQTYQTDNVVFGDTIVAPAPTKTGYTLSAWTPTPSGTVADQNYTFNANWVANNYTLTINYVDGGGTVVAPAYTGTVAFDSTYSVASPTVTGYTAGTATVEGTMNTEGKVETVVYTLNSYKATFILDGGKIDGSTDDVELMVPYGTIPQIAEPTKDGFTFGGWSPALAAQPASETTYTATWNASGDTAYTVTVYTMGTNGAYGEGVTTPKTGVTGAPVNAASAALEEGFYYDVNHAGYHAEDTIAADGTTALVVYVGRSQYNITFVIDGQSTVLANQYYGAALEAPAAAKEGYNFTGWTPAVPSTVPAANATYTAGFSVNSYPVEWTIDGVTTTNNVEFGTVPTAPAAAKEGYTCQGWFVTGDAHETIVDPIPAVGTAGAAYTAKFTVNQYTLTFIVEGETYQTITQDYGTTITPPADPEKEGSDFSCWKVDGVTTAVPPTMPAQDMTFVASFGLATFTFTYIVDGVSTSKDYEYGEVIPSYGTTDPQKTGYTFTGWTPEWPATMPAGDYTVTAQFTINTYKVKASVDGTITEYPFQYGAEVSVPNPTKEGYTFSYWSPAITSPMPAQDQNVTAVFSINKYDVAWTIDGVTTTNQVNYGTVPTAPAAAKEGYTFVGWFVTGDASETIVDPIPAVGIDGAAYTAKFTINQYTATYNLNGGNYDGNTANVVYTIDYGTEIPVPETNPERNGYTFNGWSPAPSGNIGAANVTFVAQWAQDTSYCTVKSVVRLGDAPYYECGIANWAITVEGSPNRIKICYDEDGYPTGWNYSRYNDKVLADGSSTGLVSIADGENGTEIWTIRATIPAGGYKACAKISYTEDSWEEAATGYDFSVVYNENTTVIGSVISFAVDKTEVKRGDSVTFTIVTSDNINMIRLADKVDGSSEISSTVGFTKASVGSGWADLGNGTAKWTVTAPISYVDMNKASELNTFSVYFYNEATSAFVEGDVDAVSVNVTKYDTSGEVHEYDGHTVDPYSIIEASAALGKKLTYTNITVKTTSDVSKVRLTVGTKSAVYTKTSNNVTYTDNDDGSATWVIGYRFLTAGSYNILVESRGNTWDDCSNTTVATKIYNNNAELADAQAQAQA
ncbi:MAG: InlB B-repeat-containing protein [Clostridia bacterium]|nr:InlB B-repeat-containing protein [Clostridia bacterium]